MPSRDLSYVRWETLWQPRRGGSAVRAFLGHLAARIAAPYPETHEGGLPPFPPIDGGALARPDLAAGLATLTLWSRSKAEARDA